MDMGVHPEEIDRWQVLPPVGTHPLKEMCASHLFLFRTFRTVGVNMAL